MKKLILTALLALMTLAAHALTYDVSGKWDAVSGSGSHSDNDINGVVFARLDNTYSGSQVLLTADDLVGILPKTDATGITRAKITSISVKMESNGAYIGSGSIKIDAYAQNIEESAFPVIDNKPQYFSFTKDNLATVTITPDDVAENEVTNGGIFTVTLNFGPEGFIYTGKSLLLTIFAEDTFEDWYASDPDDSLGWWNGIYTYVPGGGTRSGGYSDSTTAIETLSGDLVNSKNVIPYFLFTYEEEVEKFGPTVTEGPADVFTTPSYDSPEIGSQSSGQILPHDAYNYSNSFCQTLYTSDDLKGLNSLTNAGEDVKAKITSFIFKLFSEQGGYYSGSFSSTIYIKNVDASITDFAEIGGTKQWFDDYKDGSVVAHFESPDYYFEEIYGEIEYTVTLDEATPFIYEGGSILITWISEGNVNQDDMASILSSQVFKSDAGHSCVITTGKDLSNTSGAIQKIGYAQPYLSSYLPVLKIDYVPLTYSGGETKTQIKLANAQLGVAKAADRTGKAGNNVYMKFDIEDAADCGTYDLYLGANNKVGSITGTHGIVNFLVKTDTKGNLVDQIMTVKPQTANSSVIDGEMTIAADDIAALFKAPVVTETVGTVVYTSYYYTTSTAELRGAAAVKMTASDNAVTAISLGSGLTIMYQGNGSTGYYDAFEPLIPASATSWEISRDPAQNDGVISFYKTGSVASIPVIRREPQIDQLNGLISIKPTAEYVCLKGATVTADAPATVSTTTDSYSLKLQAAEDYRVRFTPGSELVAEIELPGGEEKIVMEEDEEYLMFYTTQGATMQYRLEPTQPEEPGINALAEDAADSSYDNSHEWTTAEKGYINLNLQENKGNKVFVRTVDTKGNARLTAYREIKADGTTSGVADIDAADAADAEYFNLQGIRVSGELTPGIYIRRQGTTATKVTVK